MRKIALLLAAAVAALSCSQKWNDLVHEEVPAEITVFEVEEQSSVKISKSTRLITVSVPAETDFSRLTVKALSVNYVIVSYVIYFRAVVFLCRLNSAARLTVIILTV